MKIKIIKGSEASCWKKLIQDLYLFSCISNIKQINTR